MTIFTAGCSKTFSIGADSDISLVTSADTAAALVVTDAIPVAAALAVCVADGASPTQAHVTTLNNAYTTLASDIAAAKVATAAANSAVVTGAPDVSIRVNTGAGHCEKHSTYIKARQLLEAALIQQIGLFPTPG